MIEDDIYRTSSQYRLWSFTPESLHSLRVTTNAVASDRVRSAIQRTREAEAQSNPPPSTPNPTPNPQTSDTDSKPEIDCLTPEEEHDFVRYYCEQTLELGDQYTPPIPTIVRVRFLPSLAHHPTQYPRN